jgi:23S rRNA pseudouridine2605 synthase
VSVHATNSTGLARALSKLGFCSRNAAWDLIKAGRVRVNGVVQRDPERRVSLTREHIEVDGQLLRCEKKIYLMLNKPRGLVTTSSDERGRETVFNCFAGANLPRIVPVGRLDKASEGLLLFTNDTAWANAITDPVSHLDKTYHVQIDRVADETLIQQLEIGVEESGERLTAKRVSLLRAGEKNSWLEVVLDEGRNRHIRRMLAAVDTEVLRLVRVAIGPLQLGTLAKGAHRTLTDDEVSALGKHSRRKHQS